MKRVFQTPQPMLPSGPRSDIRSHIVMVPFQALDLRVALIATAIRVCIMLAYYTNNTQLYHRRYFKDKQKIELEHVNFNTRPDLAQSLRRSFEPQA